MHLRKITFAGILLFFICQASPAQNKDLLFSPEGIAEIHITLADGKQINEIQSEKHAGDNYQGKVRATMTVKNSATSTYDESQFYTGKILIDGRGNTSWNRPQRPYNIDFVDDDWETKIPAELLNMPAGEEWALLNNWVDRSVMRHALAFYLGQRMAGIPWSPRNRYVEVWINDDYRGLYLLAEKILRDTNRVDVKKNNEESNNLTGGYILEATPRDGGKSKPIETQTQIQTGPYNVNFVFKYPKPKNLLDAYGQSQRVWIKNWLDEFENVLRGENYKDLVNGYQKYINEDSFIDYTILKELSKGVDDLFHASVFVQKERNGKLSMTAPWDFDLSFGNSGVFTEEKNWLRTHAWFGRLNQDDRYAQKYIARHEELIPLFNQIPEILRANYQQLEETGVLERNYQKFPEIIDDFVSDGEHRSTPTTYKGHVQFLSEWTMSRHNWMYVNLGRTDAEKGERMKKIRPVIRIMDPEAVDELRTFEVKVMRSDDNDANNKYTYSWNDANFEKKPSFRIMEKGKYWVKIKDEWGNVSLASDTLYFGVGDDTPITYWTATASSFKPGNEPNKAIDNDPNTKWDLGMGQTGEDWFAVDMVDKQSFNTIVLRQESDGITYPRLCEVYVSNNGVDWNTSLVTEAGSNEEVMSIRLPKTYEASHVKLMQKQRDNDGNSWTINDFSIQNIPYDTWFAAASAAEMGHNAKNAVDGDPSTCWSLGSAQNGGEWFTVDMLQNQQFDAIVLKQTGKEDEYPRGYDVYVALEFNNWVSRPLISGVGTYGPETRIVLPRDRTFRYLKIEQTGKSDTGWSINEFSVEYNNTAIPEIANSSMKVYYRDGHLQVLNASPEARLTVYSISGQTIKQVTKISDSLSLPLVPGIYIVVAADTEQVYKEKLIVE